jgi:hypothetical protein
VHGRFFYLEFPVEIVFGRIEGDALADFAIEVEPQFSSSGGMLITLWEMPTGMMISPGDISTFSNSKRSSAAQTHGVVEV